MGVRPKRRVRLMSPQAWTRSRVRFVRRGFPSAAPGATAATRPPSKTATKFELPCRPPRPYASLVALSVPDHAPDAARNGRPQTKPGALLTSVTTRAQPHARRVRHLGQRLSGLAPEAPGAEARRFEPREWAGRLRR